MATPFRSNGKVSMAMERTGQWILFQDIPTDVVVEVGDANFPLHKFMLVAKSNYIRKLIMESKEAHLTRINLSNLPGGPETFEKAAKFCYGFNFEITVHNVAALRCAAEYLQMTDEYCDNNLTGRTDDFLAQVALSSISGAVVVLKSCEDLLPLADDLEIVQRCVDVISIKVCNEANFPSWSPPNWWTEELSVLDIEFVGKILSAIKKRGAKPPTIATALITYTDRNLRDLVRDHSGDAINSLNSEDSGVRTHRRQLLQSVVSLLPTEKASVPINFLCCLLRSAIFLKANAACKNELENRVSAVLEHVTVDDFLVLSFSYDGERLFDLESVRKIISGFVEKEKNMAVFGGGGDCSPAMQRVAKTVDAYLGEIANYGELSISKFNGIVVLVPKGSRRVDDDLYRAIDIYLKAHPNLDEIEREKVCSVMDPLKLSYEARLHASQNKRLPVQVVLHALYFDQLNVRSGAVDDHTNSEKSLRLQTDVSLIRENEELRSEIMKLKLYISDIQKNNNHQGTSTRANGPRKPGSFWSMSKTIGKLNPFKHGSKDTSHIDDGLSVDITKPRRIRFSVS